MRAPEVSMRLVKTPEKFGQFEGCGMSTRRAAPAGMTWIAVLVATVFDSLRMCAHGRRGSVAVRMRAHAARSHVK
jgi:hypothetical protein